MVIFPITAIVCGGSLLMGMWDRRFRECRQVNNFYAGDSFIGTLYYREARYQAIMLLILSVVLGTVEYWYYFSRYINSNFSTPDWFFFTYMPLAVYLVSLVVMASRYANMYTLFRAVDDENSDRIGTTRIRFLVFFDNDLLLRLGEDGRWDTPLETSVNYRHNVGEQEARLFFNELSGLNDFQLRYCYTTNDELVPNANIVHYAVFLNDEGSVHVCTPDDRWYNAYMIDCAMQSGTLADVLVNELFRIHTITMAWKTYDRQGHRLYPVKHYRPTFRFSDMPKWDVDYDDTSWLAVADNNEDRHFYRLHTLWNRITDVFNRGDRPQ